MQDEIQALIEQIERLDRGGKQQIFEAIKDQVAVHALEKYFGISVQIICEAIIRAGDLTQRGIRGVIAETVFSLNIVPTIPGWMDATPVGDHPYDVLLVKDNRQVRIQVKMQRKQSGEPLMRRKTRSGPKSFYSVEVQRTRGGIRDGEDTRPYRFSEFDLLAVCMQPSTGDWHTFVYTRARALEPKVSKKTGAINAEIISTFQAVPPYPATDDPDWSSNIEGALLRFDPTA